ncbi:MAG: hypothetical protein IJQ24_01325 [Synergistaceae bacterium]|nr:hypothetical protein [Synergistaceae bacterium]
MEEILKRLKTRGSVRYIDRNPARGVPGRIPNDPEIIEIMRLILDNGQEFYAYAIIDLDTGRIKRVGAYGNINEFYDPHMDEEVEASIEFMSRGGISFFRHFKRECPQYTECRDVMSLHRLMKDYATYFDEMHSIEALEAVKAGKMLSNNNKK